MELSGQGLYLTHIFKEDQVILLQSWSSTRVPVALSLNHLTIFRLDTLNLILSKMMRDDPQDLMDIQFLLKQDPLVAQTLEAAFSEARCPPIGEIQQIFKRMQSKVRSIAMAG